MSVHLTTFRLTPAAAQGLAARGAGLMADVSRPLEDRVADGAEHVGTIARQTPSLTQSLLMKTAIKACTAISPAARAAVLQSTLSMASAPVGGTIGATLARVGCAALSTQGLSPDERQSIGVAYAESLSKCASTDEQKAAVKTARSDGDLSRLKAIFEDEAARPAAPVNDTIAPQRGFKFWQWGADERALARNVEFRPGPDPMASLLSDPGVTIDRSKNISTGINSSFHVWLSNGVEAIWKPTTGQGKGWTGQCEREAAAYIVDRYMGHFGGVQPCVLRDIGGQKAALMLWVKDASVAAHSPLKKFFMLHGSQGPSYQRMAVLDNVLGNRDRHDGNWMIDHNNEAVPLDHGLCFPDANPYRGITNYNFDKPVKLSTEATKALQNLLTHREDLKRDLAPLLGTGAIDAMFERAETMLAKGRTYTSWRS